jgi:hypothetical protein
MLQRTTEKRREMIVLWTRICVIIITAWIVALMDTVLMVETEFEEYSLEQHVCCEAKCSTAPPINDWRSLNRDSI